MSRFLPPVKENTPLKNRNRVLLFFCRKLRWHRFSVCLCVCVWMWLGVSQTSKGYNFQKEIFRLFSLFFLSQFFLSDKVEEKIVQQRESQYLSKGGRWNCRNCKRKIRKFWPINHVTWTHFLSRKNKNIFNLKNRGGGLHIFFCCFFSFEAIDSDLVGHFSLLCETSETRSILI